MSFVMEELKQSVSTLEEVKKLQELVRKLEIQNLRLRNKQISNRRRSDSPVKEQRQSNSSRSVRKSSEKNLPCSDNLTYNENSRSGALDEYFDDLEIISVSDIDMSDDESWLYSSPKSKATDKRENSYEWLRQDVDDPENKPLQLAKKALLTKLNELEILSPSCQLNSHYMGNNSVTNLRRYQGFHKIPLAAQNHDNSPIDTRTFTRSKKRQALDFLEKLDLINKERNMETVHSVESLNRRGSDVSSDSLSNCHALEDANDVQEVARMQEESLRMNSPMGIPKHGSMSSSCRRISTSRGSISDQDMSETSVFSAQSADDAEHDLSENDSYQIDPSHNSNHSSSSESPYGSNISLHNSSKGQVKLTRSSLPNLTNNSSVVRQSKNKAHTEIKLLHSSHNKGQSPGRKSYTNLQKSDKKHKKEFISPTRSRQTLNQVPHRGNPKFAPSPNSEPYTNVPQSAESTRPRQQPKSGLPMPSRANSASRSNVRSGIPTPSAIQNKKHIEDTWSEGCF